MINFVPAFSVFAFLRNAFFTGDKDPRKKSFLSLSFADLMARIPSFHPGYPGSIPEQGFKISSCHWSDQSCFGQRLECFKFVILEVVPCKGPGYQLRSPYSSKVKWGVRRWTQIPIISLSVEVEALPKIFVNPRETKVPRVICDSELLNLTCYFCSELLHFRPFLQL